MPKRLSKEEFIKKSIDVHGCDYDYSLVEYINYNTKVNIECKTHGIFLQTPSNHLHGYGCYKCGLKKNNRNLLLGDFIRRSNKIHKNYYDYRLFEYINNSTKSIIICPLHGKFKQIPNAHLNGSGCPTCGRIKCDNNRKIKQNEFISRCNITHNNKYDYSKADYIHNTEKITIICPLHGDFVQEAYSHLKRSGCPKCSRNGYSNLAIKWLENIMKTESIYIRHAENEGEYTIPYTRYRVDGYCKETNTAYEFYGDKFHGNLKKYDLNEQCHPFTSQTAQELYKYTMQRERTIIDNGYRLVTIWESEYNEHRN